MSRENPATIELNSVTAKSVLDENGDQSGSKEVFRSQQSLGLITQRFMNLRQRNEIMNLNEVAKELNISKRRVYDVINVLEGLGYVQKVEKNNIQWIGDSNKTEDQDKLEARVELLRQQEKVLEMMIKDAQAIIGLHFEDPISRPYNYVRKEDIRNTADPETKSIIVKSDIDSSSSFEVQVTDPSTSGSYDMIVRNKNGVKSHALLFTNDLLRENQAEYLKEGGDIDDGQMNVTLADISSEVISNEAKPEIGDLDTEDLETFVLPSSSSRQPDAPYVPETPGRGLFFSPFKTLIDPCILPSYSDDLSSGFINITTPSRIMAEQSTTERDEEPGIIALPTDTIYGISTLLPYADKLYALKQRPNEKPLGIFLPSPTSMKLISKQTITDEMATSLLPGPVTLIFERLPCLPAQFNPGVVNVACRVPDCPIVLNICRTLGQPLAQTSANVSGSLQNPTSIDDFKDLQPSIDLILDGGPIISNGEGSTIIDLTIESCYRVIRKGCAEKATVEKLKSFGFLEI